MRSMETLVVSAILLLTMAFSGAVFADAPTGRLERLKVKIEKKIAAVTQRLETQPGDRLNARLVRQHEKLEKLLERVNTHIANRSFGDYMSNNSRALKRNGATIADSQSAFIDPVRRPAAQEETPAPTAGAASEATLTP